VNLAAKKSKRFLIEEEDITAEIMPAVKEIEEIKVEPLPTKFDRSIEPELGDDPVLNIPEIWQNDFKNGLTVYGIRHSELPLVSFSLTIKGGAFNDNLNKAGTANLLASSMMEGTKNKTPVELEEEIKNLGATISVRADNESITISANSLASKFNEVFALVEEILLEPRFDEKEFERLKARTLESINRNKANPEAIADNVFNIILFGKDNIMAYPVIGIEETVSTITISDLRTYYDLNISPSVSHISIVGDIEKEKAVEVFSSLEKKWHIKEVVNPAYAALPEREKAEIYFVDMPGAKQSVIQIGNLALPYNHPDYYPATVMNHKLGGNFSSRLNLILREEKGFTYGARSSFTGGMFAGTFSAGAAVQSNATFESVQIFNEEITNYRSGISSEELEFTANSILRSNARRFETIGALMGMINTMAHYNLSPDYIKEQETVVLEMDQEKIKSLAEKYLTADRMIFVVVGDASSQKDKLSELGLGEPILIDQYGERISE
jgi:zinc protease